MQVNVNKGSSNHEIALNLAFVNQIDILLIQEPYIFKQVLSRRITKRHPSYEAFSPVDDWEITPRVLTYLRKGVGLKATQLRPLQQDDPGVSDLLFLSLSTPLNQSILLVNIYNAPPNSTRGEQAVRSLTSLPYSLFPRLTFVAGDLNLHHHLWQPSYEYSTASTAPFISWIDSLNLILTSRADEPTHDQGNVLDLAFSTSALESLGITTELSEDLETSSDHRTLLSTVYWDPRYREPLTTLRLPTLNKEVFLRSLEEYLEPLQPLDTLQTPTALDTLALELTTQIQKAFAKSAKRTYPCSIGNPWWTAECSKAATEYRQARRLSDNPLEARRSLRNAVRRAKDLFYREMLNAATSNNVFKMAKWHTSTGSYRTPPLRDPT